MKYLWTLILLFITTIISAEVYKRTNKDGNIIYSDQAHPDAEVIDIPAAPSYTPLAIPDYPNVSEVEKIQAYEISILSPPLNKGLWSNNGVPVTVEVIPSLKIGQKIIVTIDGQVMDKAQTTTSFIAPIFERGEHTISVSLQNKFGITLAESKSVIFLLHRPSVNRNP